MKIKFLATGDSPDYYEIENEILTLFHDGKKEEVDFSSFNVGDKYEGVEFEHIDLFRGSSIIDAHREETGELFLTLCQQCSDGHWVESDWIDSKSYNKTTRYIREVEEYGGY